MAEKEEHTEQHKIIEEKVLEILRNSDMDKTTEAKVRKLASEQLGLDLSQRDYKLFVRQVVNSYIIENDEKEAQKQQEEEKVEQEEEVAENEEKEEEKEEKQEAEYDDNGDLIICRLSSKRRVSWGEFKGKSYLSIREFYQKDGKELPTPKGITMNAEQWACFKENVPAIEEAIKKISSG
ncbi:RNA polymerase II transcriptional coactivator KELP [Apium graveolens]|uniref:RNA polymerase II transcriptional coactivator KELP n=1 Tax=Apium graveolens TaxID=4045 RepID=UPI003D7BF511